MSQLPSRRVLRLPQVISKSGLGRDSIYRGAREGWFPKPVKLTPRASGWFENELDEFLEKRAAERALSGQAADRDGTAIDD